MHQPEQSSNPSFQELITHQQAHAALTDTTWAHRHNASWLRDLLQSVPDAMIVVNTAGIIVFASAQTEAVLGYRPTELFGQPVDLLIPARFHHAHRHHLVTYCTRPTTRPMGQGQNLYARHKTGQEFPTEISLSSFEAPEGRLVSFVIRDITERRRLEERVRQSAKMEAIGTLAGGIAHEFNNILAGLLGFVTMLQREVPLDSRAGDYVQQIRLAGRRAKDLVQQIVTFSRAENLTREPLQVGPVVQEAFALLRASLPTTIDIEYCIRSPEAIVHANRTQLHEVIMNLGANADYAMRQTGGRLTINIDTIDIGVAFASAHPPLGPGRHVRLMVDDTGGGITPEVMARIFEPFFTTKAIGDGTGMGLAIAHGIVTGHGGTITVESAQGVGTRFAIYLPQIDAPVVQTADTEFPLPHGEGCVLFVDDEEAVTLAMRLLLESLGYDVVIHTTSHSALEAFRINPHRFDVVISDQTMPDMTGVGLAQALRRIRLDIPIILCTGFSHLIDAAKAKALGLEAFLMKPVDEYELAALLQQVLSRRRHME